MLNILPLEQKKKNLKEYRLRLVVVVLGALVSLVVVNLALLTPAYLNAVAREADAQARIMSFTGKSAADALREERDAVSAMSDVNKKINIFTGVSTSTVGRVVPSDALVNIITLKNSGIKIDGMTYDATLAREQFIVNGNALTRDNLAQFIEALKGSGAFTTVDLPIQSYVKSTNIDFTITLVRTLGTTPQQKK